MKRPSIRVSGTVAHLAHRAGIPDGFPQIPTNFPTGSAGRLDFGPSSSTGNLGPGGSGSGTPTSEMPSSSTLPPGNSNKTSVTTSVAAASGAHLPSSAVGGIAVGSSLFVLAIVVVIWLVVRRHRRNCHVQLDDGASHGSGISQSPVNSTVPLTVAAKTKPAVDLLRSPLADNDAPPAYEELALHGQDTVTIAQASPEINPVSDGFRRYKLAFEGDAKGLK